ncbi:putative membrane protein [Austwickia chelonae]|uniref:Cytochrome c oxidase assembly protein n=1 Tax=Austwickia chelonae NBRC 105200 TaxID=1184607 RepID=K6VQD2_9MICO|nr:cytochrome c oxidase assembly protein [Austwickia chelonae]GAB77560.1 hypothetical protein AUCHE_05_04730 [Austwickia chelonae NBRC 105200]SEW12897.1 putative membrane protein [Austwickia chelonae]
MSTRFALHALGDGGGSAPWDFFGYLVLFVVIEIGVGYAVAVRASRRRLPWPVRRICCWYLGLFCVTASTTGPLATAAHGGFTAHMLTHLLLGMIGPVFLVWGAPVTLLLRSLPASGARLFTHFLRSPPVRVLTHPVTAAVLNGGGLWILYVTDLYLVMHTSIVVHAVVHGHVLVAGYVFTASLVGVDPMPHRPSFRLCATTLVVFVAAHSILAKWLYAHPPAGVGVHDGHVGAQLMYYGGDLVDVTLIVALFVGRYTVDGRRMRPLPRKIRSSTTTRQTAGSRTPTPL